MKMSFETENDFLEFKQELRKRLAERTIRGIEEPGLKHAAVMMLLMNKGGDPHVLLTRRTRNVSTHKGEVSFPGGAMDVNDEDRLFAAYRETEEEVGIGRDKIEYIGRFDDYVSLAGYHVMSFIGALEYPYDFTLNRNEIESHFEAPLSMFVNREYDRSEKVDYQGREFNVYHYFYHGYEIWGLTARILTEFGEQICSN
jgi:8-oxo-dGTP pyrophosphatase MutT (NUDIX family)